MKTRLQSNAEAADDAAEAVASSRPASFLATAMPERSRTPSEVAYIDCGKGAETIVLIHGVGMRIEAWMPQIEHLSRRHRVVAVDLPGHGLSRHLPNHPDLPAFVAWFKQFLDETDYGKVNVIGHSMGALIAAGIVSVVPERIARVALLNGVHRRDDDARRAVERRAAAIASGKFKALAPMARWFREDEAGSQAYELVRNILKSVDARGYGAAYDAFAKGDRTYADQWSHVTCPALFLTGSEDANSSPEMSRDMARAAVCGTAVVIQGHRHMVNLTAPEQVNRALDDWLNTQ